MRNQRKSELFYDHNETQHVASQRLENNGLQRKTLENMFLIIGQSYTYISKDKVHWKFLCTSLWL